MTAYRFVTITCDTCGEIYDPGGVRSIPAARGMAKMEGWRHDKERGDTCPLHHGYVRLGEFGFVRDV